MWGVLCPKGGIRLKIDVWDDDNNSDDHMDSFYKNLIVGAASNQATATPSSYTLSDGGGYAS